jgi:hypothetical protein
LWCPLRLPHINEVLFVCSVRLYFQWSVGGLMSYLRYLCLLAHSGVQVILYCTLCFGCLSLVYPMLPVSLDCPFLIDPSVLCIVYLIVLEHTPIPKPTHPHTHTHTHVCAHIQTCVCKRLDNCFGVCCWLVQLYLSTLSSFLRQKYILYHITLFIYN